MVHRPQNDPKIHDESSSSAVFKELAPTQSHKIKTRLDLESELFNDSSPATGIKNIRHNEGEAAEHGIYYDDSEYDYMQHIRDLDSGGGGEYESCFVEAKNQNKDRKGKGKLSLEEALRGASISEPESESGVSKAEDLFGADMVLSRDLKQASYQNQQDIPDALAGFQPDMDPRLREVLEALEDDAYVDNEEDFFAQIADNGEELSQDDFQRNVFPEAEDEDGWESDATERPTGGVSLAEVPVPIDNLDEPMCDAPPPTDPREGDWMREFRKFKHDQKPAAKGPVLAPGGEVQSSILTGATALTAGRKKKRKGAMTDSTGYSMTSSSLARSEGLSLLDARFDKIDEMYGDGDEMDVDVDDSASIFSKNSMASRTSNFSEASGMSKQSTSSSQAPDLMGSGFGSMMDEFLGDYPSVGRKKGRNGGQQMGMAQLDELRRELGPARLRAQKAR